MEKKLDFWEMSNINAMEELSVSTPAAWMETEDFPGECRDDDCGIYPDDDDDDDDDE